MVFGLPGLLDPFRLRTEEERWRDLAHGENECVTLVLENKLVREVSRRVLQVDLDDRHAPIRVSEGLICFAH
jgi:hypothetical protein